MGVQIYILDRRTVTVQIGGRPQSVGTLRRFYKITEIDDERNGQLESVQESVRNAPAPSAVMLAESYEMPLADDQRTAVAAHLVLGWDADRASVTDMEWDYLPVLGYAVCSLHSEAYVLHDDQNGALQPMSEERAVELGILTPAGTIVRRGQPAIASCQSVRPFIPGMAAADCILADGRKAEVITRIEDGHLPQPVWYIGKRPVDAVDNRPPSPEDNPTT